MFRVEDLWKQIGAYCSEQDVFAADIFNEPFQARWHANWTTIEATAGRIGNGVLRGCLICSSLCKARAGRT